MPYLRQLLRDQSLASSRLVLSCIIHTLLANNSRAETGCGMWDVEILLIEIKNLGVVPHIGREVTDIEVFGCRYLRAIKLIY